MNVVVPLAKNILVPLEITAASSAIDVGIRNCKSWIWKRNGVLMPPHPLTNFEIQMYHQNETRFNGAYSRKQST